MIWIQVAKFTSYHNKHCTMNVFFAFYNWYRINTTINMTSSVNINLISGQFFVISKAISVQYSLTSLQIYLSFSSDFFSSTEFTSFKKNMLDFFFIIWVKNLPTTAFSAANNKICSANFFQIKKKQLKTWKVETKLISLQYQRHNSTNKLP